MNDYIPKRETLLAPWVANFSALITATPGAYGLMASDAATIDTAVTLFTAARTLAVNPGTATRPTVADKNAKKLAMLVTIRRYAQVIKHNLGVSNEAKIGLGLRIDDGTRSRVPQPVTAPILRVSVSGPLQQTLGFADSTTLERKAKPAGAIGLMLALAVDTSPPTDIAAMPIVGIATKQPYRVSFSFADKGKTAFYFARWITGAGRMGPWSAMAQMMVAG